MPQEKWPQMTRFEYDRISAADFKAGLKALEWDVGTFARVMGVGLRTAQRWASGDQDIPVWVPIVLAMLFDHPGNSVVARRVCATLLRHDREFPERGEHPYRKEEGEIR